MLTPREALLRGVQADVARHYQGSAATPALERNALAFWAAALIAGTTHDKQAARKNLRALIAIGQREHLKGQQKTIPPAPPLCGKLRNGDPCDLPSGTSCPDCGPSLIDYSGE